MNPAASGIEFRCGARTGPDRDAEVQRESRTDNKQIEGKLIHYFCAPLFFNAEFFVYFAHFPRVEENQTKKDQNRALLSKPEAEVSAPDSDTRQHRAQQNAKAERTNEPDNQTNADDLLVRCPIGVGRGIVRHSMLLPVLYPFPPPDCLDDRPPVTPKPLPRLRQGPCG